jgi:NADH dehydrogenase [ubiquinone] 1 alpha subcomplex assembly factor 7
MTELEAEIRRIIAVEGPLSVADYMAACLYHPVHGYYVTRDPLGSSGDFVTAPEISQMFGEFIGLWAAALWQQMGSPAPVDLVELGPGRGTLMADALRAARVMPAFCRAIAVRLVETSPVLQRLQRETLAGHGITPTWHRDIGELPDGPMIVVANEFFDALPIHQAVKSAKGWHERMVGVGPDGGLIFALHPDPVGRFDLLAPAIAADAPAGSIFEWRSGQVIGEIGRRVGSFGGAALVIDYGHGESAFGDTFQAIGHHAFADPLRNAGEVDLTAHVDFAALSRAARGAGACVHGPLTQGEWLRRLGIEARAETLKASATLAQADAVDAALARLTGCDRGQMGDLFKAMAIADPTLGIPPGFDS